MGEDFVGGQDEAAAGLVHDQVSAGEAGGCALGLNLHTAPHGAGGVIEGDFIMPGAAGLTQGRGLDGADGWD